LVLEINPDLDPVYLRETQVFEEKAGILYMFRYNGTSLRFPIGNGGKVEAALPAIAQNLEIPESRLSISFERNRLDPSVALDPTCEYAIVVQSLERPFEIVLLPFGSSDSPGVLRRNIAVDISQQWSKDSLLKFLIGTDIPSGHLEPFDRKELIAPFSLEPFRPGSKFYIRYPPVPAPTEYLFVDQNDNRWPLTVHDSYTVIHVKLNILQNYLGKPTVLPDVLRLSFWECDLEDDRLFLSYHIPPQSQILCTERKSYPITVQFEDGPPVEYRCADVSRVSTLRRFLTLTRGLRRLEFDICAGSTKPRLYELLIALTSPLQCIITRGQVIFSTSHGDLTMLLKGNATVAAAKQEIADVEQLDVSDIRVLNNGTPISDETLSISSLVNPSLAFSTLMNFAFEGTRFSFRSFGDTPISELRPRLDGYIGERCSKDKFDIALPDGLFPDEEMTPDDAEVDSFVITRRTPIPRTRSAPIAASRLPPPRVFFASDVTETPVSCIVTPESTLSGIEFIVRGERKLGSTPIEFLMRNRSTNATTPVTALPQDKFGKFDLIVRCRPNPGPALPDPRENAAISPDAGDIKDVDILPAGSTLVNFEFEGTRFSFRSSCDTLISDLRPLLDRHIGERCSRDKFDITMPDETVIDDVMTLDDVGEFEFLKIVRKKPPRRKSQSDGVVPSPPLPPRVLFVVGAIHDSEDVLSPKETPISCAVTPESTLAEIESIVRRERKLDENPIEFLIRMRSTRELSPVSVFPHENSANSISLSVRRGLGCGLSLVNGGLDVS
jgi:hypothetical protein